MATRVIQNADECVAALTSTLDAIEPALDVYEGILRIIAEFVPYGAFFEAMRVLRALKRSPLSGHTVRFDTGSGLEHFVISNGGLTAHHTRGGRYDTICVSPSISEGSTTAPGHRESLRCRVGVQECTFHIDDDGPGGPDHP